MKLEFVPASRDHGWYYKDKTGQVIFAQWQPIPVSVASELAKCVNAGWQAWHGGIIPADAVGRVDIQLRDGEIWQNQPADDVDWQHTETDGDVVFWRETSCGDWLSAPGAEANGWHDIEAFQLANQRLVRHADRQAVEWPDESRADRDPTAIMGGIVLAPVEQPEPPTLTVAVSAPAQPANARRRIHRVMNAILLCQASALAGQALFAIGKGWPVMAVAATATAMWAIHAATR